MKNKLHRLWESVTCRIRLLQTNLSLSKTLRLIWSVERKWTLYNIVAILTETVFFFCSLYALKILIDSISNAGGNLQLHRHDILFSIVLAGASAILYACIRPISAYITEKQSARVAEYLDDRIHESATRLDLSFYESPDYYDILKRARDAGSDRPALLIKTLSEILKNTLTFLALTTILITIDWKLIPMLFVLVLPILLVKLSFSDSLNRWRMAQTPVEREATYLGDLITSGTAAKEIRSYGLGPYFRDLYLKIRLTLLSQRLTLSYKRTKQEVITIVLGTAGFFGCIAYIALQTLSGHTTIGDITLFLVVFPQSYTLMQNISGGISIVYQNNIYIRSIFDLFELKSRMGDHPGVSGIPDNTPLTLEFRNVSFTYPHCTKPALSNVSLKIPAGRIIGLAGANGSGKTTLIKLLSRLYDVSAGQVRVNNTDIRQLKLEEYRSLVAVVFQDFVRYNFSARDNIRFGAIDAPFSEEAMRTASRNAGASEFISGFPKEYDSMMGRLFEDGVEISIGQWQKIAIARAFYSNSPLLVFDEATSSLDTGAEKRLFSTLKESIGGRSALIISHRCSALQHADFIYVLEKGKICQAGTHEQLMEEQGVYSRLFREETAPTEGIIEA